MARPDLLGRRGMSPLIATILLMAFAVALGGMIMNWSIDISINSECEDIKLTVNKFCTQEDSIILKTRSSSDSIPLVGIKLLVSSANTENIVNVKNSAIEPGRQLEIRIPVATGVDTRVDLWGVIGSETNPYVCEEHPLERVDPIKPCPE